MADFPSAAIAPGPRPAISSFSLLMAGPASPGTPASATHPTASTAYAVPLRVVRPTRVQALWLYNGTVVSGNFDLALYDRSWSRLASLGSTAQAGTSVLQKVALGTVLALGPGLFYVAYVLDNTTATVFRSAPALGALKAIGMAQMAAAFPLPATFVPASLATAHYPVLGLSLRASP